MSRSVLVQPSGKQFEVGDDEHVLEAALRQGVVIPYGCKNGACGSCKAKVLAGEYEQDAYSVAALKPDEASTGPGIDVPYPPAFGSDDRSTGSHGGRYSNPQDAGSAGKLAQGGARCHRD